jgi:acyl carrier protein
MKSAKVQIDDLFELLASAKIVRVPSDLAPEVPLTRQGLDSLDLATFFSELEGKYDRSIPPHDVAKLRTLKDIVDYLNA